MNKLRSTVYFLAVIILAQGNTNDSPPLRLVGGEGPYVGRVEIFLNNTWGTICDDFFTAYEGAVVCRQLNFTGVLDVVMRFGGGSGPILLDDVHCSCGNESSLLDCNHKRVHNCDHFEDVGIVCNTHNPGREGAVQLVGGETPSQSEGRVELFHNGEWGTLCDVDWDMNDAHVMCRELGFQGALSVSPRGTYSPGVGRIWPYRYNCTGEEDRLSDCAVTVLDECSLTDCSHSYDVGVICVPVIVGLTTTGDSSTIQATPSNEQTSTSPNIQVSTPSSEETSTPPSIQVSTPSNEQTSTPSSIQVSTPSNEISTPPNIQIELVATAVNSTSTSTPESTSTVHDHSPAIIVAVTVSIAVLLLTASTATFTTLLIIAHRRQRILNLVKRTVMFENSSTTKILF
ncbi:soluble scavenger receptor cysteine-rich domain-containing protein SSC5D-like [Halichondria panicea]|uniref:soluble scavenger receptor cysteine-rich domain-containing protein SSC5D-like n=1 Tax=Halichondria panicea TaxID=6063 RepID=UPI00312B8E17